jgi:hypothetical protein
MFRTCVSHAKGSDAPKPLSCVVCIVACALSICVSCVARETMPAHIEGVAAAAVGLTGFLFGQS